MYMGGCSTRQMEGVSCNQVATDSASLVYYDKMAKLGPDFEKDTFFCLLCILNKKLMKYCAQGISGAQASFISVFKEEVTDFRCSDTVRQQLLVNQSP